VIDAAGKLLGTVSLAELVRADDQAQLSELADASTPSVASEAEVPEVARLMSDFNLIAMPVLDGEGRPIGIIAVDDVLELLVPEEWRRRAGMARD
jgi:Mg/Co/Ni transporter MgtE